MIYQNPLISISGNITRKETNKMKDPYKMTDKEIEQDLRLLTTPLSKLVETLVACIEEEDKEVLSAYFDVMIECDRQIHIIFGSPIKDFKETIRLGLGDYKVIQEKFIRLGLV